MTDDDGGLGEGIVPKIPRHSKRSRVTHFAPWHKVRKQYIRQEQWNKFINRYMHRYLAKSIQCSGPSEWSADSDVIVPESVAIDRPLNILIIPGDDLLDMRSLHRDTQQTSCYIRYLGFNERHGSNDEGTKVFISHNDVTSSDRVSQSSVVVPDPFQRISNKNSQAWRYVKELGPFHVVNLDLCDSLFPNIDGDIGSYVTALHTLVDYQLREMSIPWMLFVTTEVAPSEVDTTRFDRFCEPAKENCRKYAEFKTGLSTLIATTEFLDVSTGKVDTTELDGDQLVNLFGVAFGKVLLHLCSTATPKWRLRMLGSHRYKINSDKGVAMLSLAFQFDPVTSPPSDGTGLSSANLREGNRFDELDLATKLLAAVSKITDIDQLLSDDQELKDRLRNASADLLVEAGYDRNDYLDWIANGEPTTYE